MIALNIVLHKLSYIMNYMELIDCHAAYVSLTNELLLVLVHNWNW